MTANIWRQQPSRRLHSWHLVDFGGQGARKAIADRFFKGSDHFGTASLSGTGALAASGAYVWFAYAALSGTGALSASGVCILGGRAVLLGEGALSVEGGLVKIMATFDGIVRYDPVPDALLGRRDCDECGFEFGLKKLSRRFDGAMVCEWCLDFEHASHIAKRR